MDKMTGLFSVHDMILQIVGCKVENCQNYFTRVSLRRQSAYDTRAIRINDKGRQTPVATKEVLQIIGLDILTHLRASSARKLEILSWFGVEDSNVICVKLFVETEIIPKLIIALEDYDPVPQHAVGKYRIDLYLKKVRLAIECDENGHRSYDSIRDDIRTEIITSTLSCDWFRFNPSKQACVFTIIRDILRMINKDNC